MSASDDRRLSPRDRARQDAATATGRLSIGLLAYGAFEAVVATVDTIASPASLTTVVAMCLRGLFALALAWLMRGFGAWGRALGLGAWPTGITLLAILSALLSLTPVVDLRPATVPLDLWEPLVRLLAATFLVGALVLTILMTARMAKKDDLAATGRILAWSALSPAGALLSGLTVLDPALLPTPWLGPIAPLVVLVIQSVGGIVPWSRTLAVNAFTLLLGGLLLAMEVPFEVVALLGALIGIVIAAVMPRGQLADVASVLGEEPAAGPSRTFIRRLLAGPTESQVVMDLRLGSQASATNEEESLALAYRELGIAPPKPRPKPSESLAPIPVPSPVPAAAAPAPSLKPALPPMPPMAKLEPVTKTGPRPAVTATASSDAPSLLNESLVGSDLAAWAEASDALRLVFLGFITRTATAVFGFMLMRAPIAREGWLQLLGVGLLVLASGMMAQGLFAFSRTLPLRRHAPTARIGAALATLVGLSDLGIGGALLASPEHISLFGIASAAGFLVLLVVILVLFARLFGALGQRATSRIVTVLLELAVFTGLGLGALAASMSDESDVTWLAYPTVIGAGLAGFVLFATFLWLIHDMRSLLIDWQTRVRRARNPEITSEEEDPRG